MKKTLLLAASFLMTALGMQAAVGDDLTSKYLQNANFTADEPLHYGVTTYAKDAAAAGTTMSGMQPVTNWTANYPYIEGGTDIDARAAGVFELGKQYVSDYTGKEEDQTTPIFLGGTGFVTPAPDESLEGPTSGNVLGIVAVWGADAAYTQPVTLPAGAYTISFLVYNGGGETAVAANEFGFKADDGTTYYATETTWGVNVWSVMTVNFSLSAETSGVISLGYKAAGAGSAAMPHLYIPYVKILEGDQGSIEKEKADALRPELETLLQSAAELGVDATAEQAVYDNENATAAEVQAAIDSLKKKNAEAMTDFTDYFINNAHFALGTPMDAGVCTYDYDMEKNSTKYYGMQPIQDWTASNPSTNTVEGVNNGRASGLFAVGSSSDIWLGSVGDVVPATKASGATEGNLFGFISVWSGSASYTQNVTLPAGSYTITIPTYNERGTGAVAKNLCGFIADDGTEYLATTTTFEVGKWSDETIKFTLDDETSGVITIGYQAANAGSASMPHLFIDEFTLKFNGKTDIKPSLIALNGAIRSGETYLDSDDPYYEGTKNALQDAVDAGTDLKDAGTGTDEENSAAATAINNAITDVKASIAVYKNFKTFIDGTLTEARDKYAEGDLADFGGQLADDVDTYTTAYESGEYTTEQINEIINGFSDRVATAVSDALTKAAAEGGAHDIDITCLIKSNISFANKSIADWTCTYSSGKFESQQDGVVEVWSASAVTFDASTTITDLPQGVYQIKVPGFYRNGAITDNYAAYLDNKEGITPAYLYANGNTVLLHNQAEMASDTQDDLHNGDASGAYLPNGQSAAQSIFRGETDYDMTNTVSGAVLDGGSLTFGTKATELADGGSWVCWGAATIIYKGTEGMESALYAELQSKMSELDALEETTSSVRVADEKVQAAKELYDECSEESSQETLITAIKATEDAIDYAKEAKSAIDELTETYTIYNDYLASQVESEEESFGELLATIGTALEDGSFENNDQINGYKEQLAPAFTKYVQYPCLSATEENPGDISAAILNRGFEGVINDQSTPQGSQTEFGGNGGYWTKSRVGGNDFGYQAGVYESWNTDTFNISQSIKGLAAGYYRISVQSFFRANNDNQINADEFAADTTHCAAFLYANSTAGEYSKQIVNQVENGGQAESLSEGNDVAVTLNEASIYVPTNRTGCAAFFDQGLYWNTMDVKVGDDGVLTLGIQKTTHVYGDWCPFDNFKLEYLGTTEPTAVEGVKADANTAAGATIYDLAGRKVSKAVKGIYIVNGKKVIK